MSHDSDPLPYIQWDRAANARAVTLALQLNVPPQLIKGTMLDFWDSCGDPRELEKLIEQGIERVVLSPAEVAIRFRLASGGKEVEPWLLASVGFLEELKDGNFRVRGMSRFFKPVRARMASRIQRIEAGKASARARKERFGTAQPSLTPRSAPVDPSFESRSGPVRSPFDDRSERPPNDVRTTPERPPNDVRTNDQRPPNTAVSGQRSPTLETGLLASPAFEPRDPEVFTPAVFSPEPAGELEQDDPERAVAERFGPRPVRDISHLGYWATVGLDVAALDRKSRDFKYWADGERKSRRLGPPRIEATEDAVADWYLLAHAKHGLDDDDLRKAYLHFLDDWGLEKGRDGAIALFISSENVWLDRARELKRATVSEARPKPALRIKRGGR